MSIKVLVAHDKQLLLDAAVHVLESVVGLDVVSAVCELKGLVAEARRVRPTVAVLGLTASGYDELDQARDLIEAVPNCRVVVLAMRPTRVLVDQAIEAGVLSVVPFHAKLPNLLDAIYGVARGCVSIDLRLLASSAGMKLTDREREILRLTAQGSSVNEIASELYLSSGTIRNLTSLLIKRIGGRSRFDTARIAKERGWI
ncbi:MAG: response regulator transcription factor [Pseudonocardia sp.]|nr:response regulator transcription factor [Pseudonocardia sp.]